MLKVPTYVIGSLLFLTGLLGYLVQDPGLTLKLKGPLANNAKFLSDGAQTHELDLYLALNRRVKMSGGWLIN